MIAIFNFLCIFAQKVEYGDHRLPSKMPAIQPSAGVRGGIMRREPVDSNAAA